MNDEHLPPCLSPSGYPLCDVRIRRKEAVRHHLDPADATALAAMGAPSSGFEAVAFRFRDDGSNGAREGYMHRTVAQRETKRLMGLRADPDEPELVTADGHDGAGIWYAFTLVDGAWRFDRMWRH